MKKKSKWQQRLEEVQKRQEEMTQEAALVNVKLHTEDDLKTGDPTTHTAQPPDDEWIPMEKEKPTYYTPVDIMIKFADTVLEDFHRLSDGDHDYYASLKSDRIISNPSHWRKRKGIIYRKYEPMTEDDIKAIPIHDIETIIDVMKADLITDDKPILSTNDVKELIREIKEVNRGDVNPTDADLMIARITGLISFFLTDKIYK